MNNTRLMFALALSVVAFLLLQQWQIEQLPKAPAPSVTQNASDAASGAPAEDVPGALPAPAAGNAEVPTPVLSTAAPAGASVSAISAAERIVIESDVLRLSVDLRGAEIVHADLLKYPVSLKEKDKLIRMLGDVAQNQLLRAQTGFVASTGKAPTHTDVYRLEDAATTRFQIGQGASLSVPFVWEQDGVVVRKTMTLKRGSYTVDVRFDVSNQGGAPWVAANYRQLQRTPAPALSASFFTQPEAFSYVGPAIYSPDTRFEKRHFDDFAEEPLDRVITGGWMALLQHHFLVSWIPDATQPNRYTTQTLTGDASTGPRMLIRQITDPITLAPGASYSANARLYVGPKLQNQLATIAPGLAKSIDYGKVTIFAEPLFWALDKFHSLTNNWGWAIVLLVLLIKILFYKLSEAQYRSGARMKALAPKMEEIKRRHGDDRQKQGQAMMELYKKEKVNPLAGCFPLLIQIPVFFGLYWVLVESPELRQAPFIGWIKDLTAADPYFVLPALNMATMYATTKMTPMTGMDPIQQKMFTYMPLLFGLMMAFFPAGLVLYWTVNGALGLAQQYYITKKLENESSARKANA
jgi:YidC/Oxa1 family membrane protein insertase